MASNPGAHHIETASFERSFRRPVSLCICRRVALPARSAIVYARACYNLEMILLYTAQDLVDAQMLVDQLNESGIEATVRNSELQGAIGELPWSLRPEVCILDPRDLERAIALKEEYERLRAKPIIGDERICPACGESSPPNFEVCWKCRKTFA